MEALGKGNSSSSPSIDIDMAGIPRNISIFAAEAVLRTSTSYALAERTTDRGKGTFCSAAAKKLICRAPSVFSDSLGVAAWELAKTHVFLRGNDSLESSADLKPRV